MSGGMQAMSIDMDEEFMPSNTSSNLGTRDQCRRINENNALDGDEDFIDGLNVDITATGIPPYHDPGTPSDPADDTGGITAYTFRLNYEASDVMVSIGPADDPDLNILARYPHSEVDTLAEPTLGSLFMGSADYGPLPSEDGSGVLDRLKINTLSGAGVGLSTLTLVPSDSEHADAGGLTAHAPLAIFNAEIAIGTACSDSDGDSIAESQDACPLLAGPESNNGCPPPGPPAVGGTAGLIDASSSYTGPRIATISGIAGAVTALFFAGGLLVRRLAVRPHR